MSDLWSNWHYQDDDGQGGPVTAVELKGLHRGRKFPADGLVWHPSMDAWRPLREVWSVVKEAAAAGASAQAAKSAAPATGSRAPLYKVVTLTERPATEASLAAVLNELAGQGWTFDCALPGTALLVFHRPRPPG